MHPPVSLIRSPPHPHFTDRYGHRFILLLFFTLLSLSGRFDVAQAEENDFYDEELNTNESPATTSTASDSQSPELAALLTASSRTPLLQLTAAEFTTYTSPASRPYSLLVFFTASQQCVACSKVEAEIERVARAYEQARYDHAGDEGDRRGRRKRKNQHKSYPHHHLFFASLDAHYRHRTQRVGGNDMINLPWFQAQGISKVPELFLLDWTVPEGVIRGSGQDTSSVTNSTIEGSNATDQAILRYQQRLKALAQRRWQRMERLHANSSNLTPLISDQTHTVTLIPRPTGQTPEPVAPSQSSVTSNITVPNWRNTSQIHTYPVGSGLTSQQLLMFLREHTEGHLKNHKNRDPSTPIPPMTQPLHRSLVVRMEGLNLSSTLPAASSGSDIPGLGLVLSLAPFFTSFLLFGTAFILYRFGTFKFAIVPLTFYLWCIVGTMNNIQKDMPVVGMGQYGPMFFYPGHGSFVGESILMAILYGYCSLAIICMNTRPIWEFFQLTTRRRCLAAITPPLPYSPTKGLEAAIPTTTKTATATSKDNGDGFDSDEDEDSNLDDIIALPLVFPSQPTIISSSSSSAQKRNPRSSPSDIAPFQITTAHWIMFFVFTLHFAFSIIRAIYTRKNGRYQYGYLF